MNNFDYKYMTPFKWFVLENFPFIENDFEAINNYRLFSKVVEYLNKTIDNMNLTGEQMENVTNAMTELQNYVNNYFDNLDVQDEINNKLDEMVEDGTFDNIFNNLFTPFKNEIEEDIENFSEILDNFNNKINSLTSLNPIPVNSITDMTDTTKSYLLTTDGYWYYYNGTEWVQGGLYQSTEIEENSIGYLNLKNELKKETNIYYNENSDIWQNGYYDTSGSFHSTTGYSTTKPIKVFKDTIIKTNVNGGTLCSVIFECDIDGNYISTIKAGNSETQNQEELLIIDNEKYLRFSYRNVGISSVYINIKNNRNIKYYDLENSLKQNINLKYNKYDDIWTDGYYDTSGLYHNSVGHKSTIPIKVYKGTKIKTNLNGANTVSIITKVNSEREYISTLLRGSGSLFKKSNYLEVTEDCYLSFAYRNVDISDPYIIIKNINNYNYNDLSINLQKNINVYFNKDTNIWNNGYYETNGTWHETDGFSMTDPIQVFTGTKIETNANGQYTVSIICKCDENGNFIENLKAGTGTTANDISYVSNENCLIRVTYRNVDIDNVYVNIINNSEEIIKNSSIYGARYCSEGDSITNRNGKNSSNWSASQGYTAYETPIIKGFQSYVVNEFNCSLDNFGVGGATILDEFNNIMNRDYSNYDLVTIGFGTNDARTSVALGILGSYSDTSFDTTTYTGAYRRIIEHMLSDNPNIKIVLLTPPQRHNINNFGTDTPNANGDTLKDFANRIKEIAKLYSLIVCDFFNESEINQVNLYQKSIDGVHPNNSGYENMGKLLCNTLLKF